MPEITAKLSTALADRYRIERHLGEGGMAAFAASEPWGRNYDITPDGERFLMIMEGEPTPAPTRFTLTLNWFEELKAKVGNE